MRSKLIARVLIVLTFLGASGSGHASNDDPELQPRLVAHDHNAHQERFGGPLTTTEPTHCAICHWLQSFRSDSVRDARVQFSDTAYSRRPIAATGHVGAIDLLDIPSRAPPA